MNHVQLVNEYIDGQKLAWARTSIKNERSRLLKHGPKVMEKPAEVYISLAGHMKDHSIKTTFVRLGQYFQWLVDNDKIKLIGQTSALLMCLKDRCNDIDQLVKALDLATDSLRKISSGLTTDQAMVERMTKREADEALKEIYRLGNVP